ncbi:hypothetical protein ABEX14_16605 [Bacillus toyonensis]
MKTIPMGTAYVIWT